MTPVVAIAAAKGGVGTTSITTALAGHLASSGHRVALVEVTSTGDAADDLGVRDHRDHDDGASVYAALRFGTRLGHGIEARENLSYFPGGHVLRDLPRVNGWSPLETPFRRSIDVLDGYDVVLMDTPPKFEQLQMAGLTAATHVLMPTGACVSSIRALYTVVDRIVAVRQTNPGLEMLGVVLWGIPTAATRLRAETLATLNSILEDAVRLENTVIRNTQSVAYELRRQGILPNELASKRSVPFWELLSAGMTVELTRAAERLAGDYADLAEEIMCQLAPKPMAAVS